MIDLDLDDAAVGDVPVFREISFFLGSARGGIFEDGALLATIGNRQIEVEQLALAGRLVQLHASGTVGFDARLDLEVLVNTNQIISETGEALVARIPGLPAVLGNRRQSALVVSNFLSNRLIKLHVTGDLRNPTVNIDPAVAVGDAAVGFFGGVLKLPLGFLR